MKIHIVHEIKDYLAIIKKLFKVSLSLSLAIALTNLNCRCPADYFWVTYEHF
jgi:hypothetical protein